MKDGQATQQPALRKDAARNHRRIMDAARVLVQEGKPIQLNAVAQAADVGVGTVYRHFPSPEALVEALAADRFAALIHRAGQAAAEPDASRALRDFLKDVVTACLQDDAFAAAAVGPAPATADITVLRGRLQEVLHDLLVRAAADDTLRPELTVADMMLLVCAIGFAARHAPGRDRPGLSDRYLDALLDGALTRHGRGG